MLDINGALKAIEFGLLALWMIVVLAVGRGLFVRKEV